MCTSLEQLSNISSLPQPIFVNLPYGTTKYVRQIGDVKITPRLVLKGALYTPYFRFNLMSINKISNYARIKFVFFPDYCALQDLKTNEVLAQGKMMGGLYVLDDISAITKNDLACNSLANNSSVDVACNKGHDGPNDTCNISCVDSTINCIRDFNSIFNNTDEMNHSIALNTSHLCTWHKRLADAPYNVLQHISSPDVSAFVTNKTELQACEICHKAKQKGCLSQLRPVLPRPSLSLFIWMSRGPTLNHLCQGLTTC